MSYLLPHLHTGYAVDQAILSVRRTLLHSSLMCDVLFSDMMHVCDVVGLHCQLYLLLPLHYRKKTAL